ncbi:hypothetical protein ACTFIZ_005541 [Dictyostelium cf. discoideum]
MDKFVIIKCINPGFISPKEEKKEEAKKEEPKKEEPKNVEIKSETKKKRAAKSKPTNNTTTSSTTSITTTTTTTTDNNNNNNNNNESTKTGLAAILTPVTEIKKQPQQTLVSHFFSVNTGDKPSYKFLFEKEAADRAEEERKRAERIAKEEAILAEKRKQIQKAKLEAKKKRELERRKKEEEEWEEYLAMQEKTTKGVEIIPHLYLGSFLAAKNSEWLLEANVTKIVNVTSEVPSYFLSKKEKENDNIISEKDEINSFIVDDDDDEDYEDIDDDDDEDDEDIDEEDKDEDDKDEDEGDEDGHEDENVDIGDEKENNNGEKDKEMKDLTVATTNEKKEENMEMKDDAKQVPNDDKDQEIKDSPIATTTTTAPSTNEKKEENVEMKDELTTSNDSKTNNTSIKIDQVIEDVDSEKIKELSIKYLRISISDSFRSKIENYFQEAIDFINQGNVDGSEKSNVLIHCKQGRSRSPSIVIAYLMSNEKWTLEKAFNHVSSVSPKNLTVNDGFKKKLMDLEMELFGSNSINFFDRSNRSSRANISSAAINSTLNISQKRIKNQNKKKDDINNIDNDNNNEDNKNKNEENIVDTTAVTLQTNLEVEDDAPTIDQLKVVKRRKNISVVEDDE